MRSGRAVAVVAAATLTLACAGCARDVTARPATARPGSNGPGTIGAATGRPGSDDADPRTSPSAPSVGDVPGERARRHAARTIRRLTRHLGHDRVSVDAVDLTSGAALRAGSRGGMTEGSIAKLDIAQTLMLQHQDDDDDLDDEQRELLTAMLEHSDNDAANTLWTDEGGRRAVGAANTRLGLTSTVLGEGIYWGLSTTDAADQLALLRALVRTDGPLTPASQSTVLHLLRHVEADQRWGVGVVADGTRFANKNGWLANLADGDRWLVNSLGLLRVDDHVVLMAVLTQHDPDFEDGIELTEHLARVTVRALEAS